MTGGQTAAIPSGLAATSPAVQCIRAAFTALDIGLSLNAKLH